MQLYPPQRPALVAC